MDWDLTLVASVISSSAISTIVIKYLEKRKDKAQLKNLSAEELRILAEVKKINIDADSSIGESWRIIAKTLKEERDIAVARIAELEAMLEEECRIYERKIDILKLENVNIVVELRKQLKDERERYDAKINDIISQILNRK